MPLAHLDSSQTHRRHGFCGTRITFFMLCCQIVDPNWIMNLDHEVMIANLLRN